MMIIIGLLAVFGLVFGGYLLSGGSMEVMLHALPFEGMMVGGAALGAFIIANSFDVVKRSFGAVLVAFKGPRWKPNDYGELLQLLYQLARCRAKDGGVIELEKHINDPSTSDIFSKYPKILKDKQMLSLIVDAFRMVTLNFEDADETNEIINRKLEAHQDHLHAPIHALNMVADGLPAIGIVAAVLGVIKTMSSVDKPPEVLGVMIGGALVGTFLGVFAAYCFIMPLAQRIEYIEDQDASFGQVIRDVIVAIIRGHKPDVCVEIGRGNIPPRIRPSFEDIERQTRGSLA